MHFTYALYMCHQNLVSFSYLCTEPVELFIEIVFHYCTTPPYHKIHLYKRPFWGSHFERLDDAFVLLISLIFLYPPKINISGRSPFKLWDE